MIVERKELTWFERLYLPQVVAGLWTTFKHMFRKKVTMQYPEQKWTLPQGYRGAPTLVKDPENRIKCVSCQLCEFICPPKAIRIVPGQLPTASNVEKGPKEFEIDMLRCIYCGMCEEVCPEEAIFLKEEYAIVADKRQDMKFNKEKLLEMGGVHQDRIYKWKNK